MIDLFLVGCQYPYFEFNGVTYPINYCDGLAADVQLTINLFTSWALYILTTIAVFQMVLKSIFGIAPLFGVAADAADDAAFLDREGDSMDREAYRSGLRARIGSAPSPREQSRLLGSALTGMKKTRRG